MFACAPGAWAQSIDFGYTYSTANIVRVDFQSGARTNVFAFSGQITAATANAVDLNGDVYVTSFQAAGPVLYRWNAAAPGTLVTVGTVPATLPAPVTAPRNSFVFGRLAFDTAGDLFTISNFGASPLPARPYLVRLNKATGAIISVNDIPTPTYGGPDLPAGGGDLAYAPNGRLFVSGSTAAAVPSLWEIDTITGNILGQRNVTGLTNQRNIAGAAFSILGDFIGLHQPTGATPPYDLFRIAGSNFTGASWTGTGSLAVTVIEATGLPAFGDLGAPTTFSISGRVFEDVNYGGGAGRSQGTSSGVAIANARIELYDNSGNYITAVTTDSSGDYAFRVNPNVTYQVRVVYGSVRSSRTGGSGCTTCVPVQTFRTDGSGAVSAITDRVGGEAPEKDDAAANTTNANLSTLNTATTAAQSLSTVAILTTSKSGVDFGFNFNTIVNTRDSGAGSLRQFMINANALGGEASLAQAGSRTNLTTAATAALPTGRESTIFMIADGAVHAGLRAGLVNQLTGGVAVITPTTALPALSDANATNTIIDGGTQTFNVGNTNSVTIGVGGTVGVDAVALPTLQGPEVQIQDGAAALAAGLDIQANNTTLRGVSMFGFGTRDISTADALSGIVIESNVLGSGATAFADPGAANRSGSVIQSLGADGTLVQNNLIGFTGLSAMLLQNNSNAWQILSNEIRNTAITSAANDAINMSGSGGATVQQNRIDTVGGIGVDMAGSTGTNTVRNNTITNAGVLRAETGGIRAGGAGNNFDRNILNANAGAGIMIPNGVATNTITRNSMFGNGAVAPATNQIGIDLHNTTDNAALGTAAFVTLNDNGDGDAGGNGLLNYPVLIRALIQGSNLTLEGFARPGSVIEFFVAAADPSGFGEGQTHVATLTEGSGADTDGTTGTYGPGAINGVIQGTDTTNRFAFTIATPGAVAPGTQLTATATVGAATSEFSAIISVGVAVPVSGSVYHDVNHNLSLDGTETGSGQTLFVKLQPRSGATCSGNAIAFAAVTPATGAYTINNVVTGDYCLVLDTNSTLTDVTPNLPAGWISSEVSNGVRQFSVTNAALVAQNFGVFNGSRLTGRVFHDTGIGGGTPNNGTQDGAEIGVANAAVRANNVSCPSTLCDSTVTNASGDYTLWIAAAATGSLSVTETNAGTDVSTGGSAGTTGGSYARASDTTTFTITLGSSYSGVNFADVPANSFLTDGALSGEAGSSIHYTHRFVAGTGGTVAFATTNTPTPALAGWSNVIYRDSDCDATLDAAEAAAPLVSTSVNAGDQLCLIVKEFIPAAATNGAQNQISITATFTYVNAAPALNANYTRNDVTTVGAGPAGALRLTKSVDRPTALPGELLTYTISYVNNGSGALTNIAINDTTAAFTTFQSASCVTPLPANLTSCSVTVQPSVGGTGAIRWTLVGSLAPAASGSVQFVVQVQP